MGRRSIQEWEQSHALLLAKQRQLTQMSVLHARGQLPREAIAATEADVEALRQMEGVRFQIAFGYAEG